MVKIGLRSKNNTFVPNAIEPLGRLILADLSEMGQIGLPQGLEAYKCRILSSQSFSPPFDKR